MREVERIEVQQRHPVLYVDDEASNRLIFEAQFEDDFNVIVVSSAEEALETMGRTEISVLVTDQRMPGASGIDLCEQVRGLYPSIYRILLTAYSDQATAIEAINRGGVQAFIVKPWRQEQVEAELRSAIFGLELKVTVQSLKDSLAERERLLSVDAIRRGLLHDISSPVSAASLVSEELRLLFDAVDHRLSEGERQEGGELLFMLEDALGHLRGLQQSFRQGPRSYEHQSQRLGLSDLLNKVSKLVEPDPRIALTMDCSSELFVRADQLGLSRVLVNLINNARQAIVGSGQAAGRITVSTRIMGELVQLRVCDDGPGVPEDRRERIFRAEYTTKENSGGMGLGLSISRELVERDGGSLRCFGAVEGGGACFELMIPVDNEGAAL